MKSLLKEISKKIDILFEQYGIEPATEHCDYVVINHLKWDRENTEFEFTKHFTFNEANRIVADLGKRLPTKQEFEELLALGSTWDKEKQGRWFGYDHTKKSQSKCSVFFPAAGCRRTSDGALRRAGESGKYWSSTQLHSSFDYSMYFNSSNTCVYSYYRYYGFSVRCVSE